MRTHSLARAAEPLNPKRTAAGDLEREVITISELATSAEPQAATPGKGRVRGARESKALQRRGRRRVQGALLGPVFPRCSSPAPWSRGAYGEHLRLGRCGVPRRGAPSRAPEASRLASTWAGKKFAKTHPERLAAPDSGGRRGL